MIYALIVMGGMIVAAVAQLPPLSALVLGAVAGTVVILMESRRPRPKPAYLAPAARPSPLTRRAQLVIIAGIACGSLFLTFVAFRVPQPELGQLISSYFAGYAGALAVGMTLNADRDRERYNRWVASMSPKLDTEQ